MSERINGKPPYILVADDHHDTLEIFEVMARHLGYEVDTTDTAEGILDKVNTHCKEGGPCYDIIIADVNFANRKRDNGPQHTGITAIAKVREKYPNVPVIFYTGYLTYLVEQEIKGLPGAEEALTETVEKTRGPESGVADVLDRVENQVVWARAARRNERRTGQHDFNGAGHRATDPNYNDEIRVSPTISSALTEARLLRANSGGDK